MKELFNWGYYERAKQSRAVFQLRHNDVVRAKSALRR